MSERAPLLSSGGTIQLRADSTSGLSGQIVQLLYPDDAPEERGTVRERYRARAERNQQQARTQQVVQTFLIAVIVFALAAIVCMGISIVYFCMGWYVIVSCRDADCDQPLWGWLLVYSLVLLLVPVIRGNRIVQSLCCWCPEDPPPERVQMFRTALGLVNPLWLLHGAFLVSRAESCAKTAPYMYDFVVWYIIFMLLNWVVSSVLVMVALMLTMWLVDSGIVQSRRAAGPEVIARLQEVKYSPDLFSEDGTDSRPPPECCICQSEYSDKEVIVRTPCLHYYHQSCLAGWLDRDRICPLCRLDLVGAFDDHEP